MLKTFKRDGLVAQSLGLSRNLRILPYLVTDYTINIKLD
jgi:hypothetical protein